jgi:hypothetical protein
MYVRGIVYQAKVHIAGRKKCCLLFHPHNTRTGKIFFSSHKKIIFWEKKRSFISRTSRTSRKISYCNRFTLRDVVFDIPQNPADIPQNCG